MNEVTRILDAIGQGDASATGQLLPLVYDELRRLAAQRMAQEKPGQTFSRRPWSTRHTCAWSVMARSGTGTAAATSSPPRPRPCAGSSSRTPAASGGASMAATGQRDSTWTTSPWQPSRPARSSWPSTRPWIGWRSQTPRRLELVKLRYFLGLTIGQAAQILGVAPHGEQRVDLRQGLAAPSSGAATRRTSRLAEKSRMGLAISVLALDDE